MNGMGMTIWPDGRKLEFKSFFEYNCRYIGTFVND